MDSGDDGATTEGSFDYDDGYDEMCRDSFYSTSSTGVKFQLKDVPIEKRRNKNLKDLSQESCEEFPDELGSPDEIDLEKFRRKYLNTDKMIPEETDEDIEHHHHDNEDDVIKTKTPTTPPVRTKSNRKVKSSPSDDMKMTSESISQSVKSDVTMVAVDLHEPNVAIDFKKDQKSGVFQSKHYVQQHKQQSSDIKKQISTESSTEADSVSVDLPTITITEDALHDTITSTDDVTLRGSLEDVAEIPVDTSSEPNLKMRAEAIKVKVKELGGKVKDLFHKSPSDETSHQIEVDPLELLQKQKDEEEKKKRREEDLKKKREEELRKKELEMMKKESEVKKREAEKKAKDEEKRLRDEEKVRKLQEKKIKDEEARIKREEEKMRKDEEARSKKELDLKKRQEEAEKKELLLKQKKQHMDQVKKQKDSEKKQLEYEIKRKREEQEEEIKRIKHEEEQEMIRRRVKKSEEEAIDILHHHKGSNGESFYPVTISIVDAEAPKVHSADDDKSTKIKSGVFVSSKDHLGHIASSSQPNRKQLSTESSTEIESVSVDLPTITMTGDITLHDTIEGGTGADGTLRGSLEDVAELPSDHETRKFGAGASTVVKQKAEAVKEKVIELSGKVKEKLLPVFKPGAGGETERSESESAVESEVQLLKKKKKEEDLKKKREEELMKKEMKLKRRQEEQMRRHEEKRNRDQIRMIRLQEDQRIRDEVESKYQEVMEKIAQKGWEENPYLKRIFNDSRANKNPYLHSFRSSQSQPRELGPVAPPRTKRKRSSSDQHKVKKLGPSDRSASVSRLQSNIRDHPLEPFNRSSDRSCQATNPLFWKPFSWKTGRCRSLTELYLEKRTIIYANQEVAFENSLRYRLTNQYCTPRIPERPLGPLPLTPKDSRPPICPVRRNNINRRPHDLTSPTSGASDSSTEPIYASIRRYDSNNTPKSYSSSSAATVRRRRTPNFFRAPFIPGLPRPTPSGAYALSSSDVPPPLPPKPDNLMRFRNTSSSSRSMSPVTLGSIGSFRRDASVSTDNISTKTLEKEVQTSLEDVSSLKEDTRVNTKSHSPVKHISSHVPPVASHVPPSPASASASNRRIQSMDGDENANYPVVGRSSTPPVVSPSAAAAVSSRNSRHVPSEKDETTTTSKTIGSYYDAEDDLKLSEDEDHDISHLDPDTFVGIESIIDSSTTSHFVSMNTPTPDHQAIVPSTSSDVKNKKRTPTPEKESKKKTRVSSAERKAQADMAAKSDPESGMRRSSSALDVGVSQSFSRSGSGGRRHKKKTRPSSGPVVRSAESSDEETQHIIQTFWTPFNPGSDDSKDGKRLSHHDPDDS